MGYRPLKVTDPLPCGHPLRPHQPVPVESVVTGEVVAYICERCLEPCSGRSILQQGRHRQ
jgi:hypothetical protein